MYKYFHYVRDIIPEYNFSFLNTRFLRKENNSLSTDLRNFNILNEEIALEEILSNEAKCSRLWLYNFNYFDFLNHVNCKSPDHEKLDFLSNIITNSKFRLLREPYPISLRIVNILKWISESKIHDKSILDFIYQESNFLYYSLEWDLLANHLFANAKALIFSGIFFDSMEANAWFSKAKQIIFNQLEEQVLEDGGHFESSPMYHSIILEDLIEIYSLLIKEPSTRDHEINILKEKINLMLSWLQIMIHPDGDISFFNDANFQVAENLTRLRRYSEFVDPSLLSKNKKNVSLPIVHDKSSSGFYTLEQQDSKIFFNIGNPSPYYNPGHFHADTLSLEISFNSERVIVNTGVSTYEEGLDRAFERSTEAHNTVLINQENSSEVWKSFRVARNANVTKYKHRVGKNYLYSSAQYTGINSSVGISTHKRSIISKKGFIMVSDKIFSSSTDIMKIWIFHPDCKISQIDEYSAWIEKGHQNIKLISSQHININDSYYAPEFALKIPCKKIISKFIDSSNTLFIF